MPDLLLELFSEEIPARMQKKAGLDLFALLDGELKIAGLAFTSSQGFSTTRRLAIILNGLPAAQPDVTTELKGPKINAPEIALEGFLKKNNLKKSDLTERDGVYFSTIHQKGKPTADILKTIIEKILAEFPWPKSMRWGTGVVTWVRPLHSILCIFDGTVMPVEFGGVKAGNVTYGHRFLNPEAITIGSPAEYEAKLEKANVIADRGKRMDIITGQAKNAAEVKGLVVKQDEILLEEVAGLVEWPVVLMGTIDAAFMDLPKEVLISEMRAHQKYFSLENKNGAFSDKFLITSNMEARDGGKAIIAGNERVLRARLADGRFFWDQDRKKPLDQWAEGLKNITFHAKLGSVADKVERIKALALQLTPYVSSPSRGEAGRGARFTPAEQECPLPNPPPNAEGISSLVERAATLCKADLTTGMVGEFPELQGVMGRYYALAQGGKTEVADAIRDHYKPQGPNDSVPTQSVSICIALADKLDTLISMFFINERPTGSKDPFALRRSALGVIRIVLENDIRLNLAKIIDGHYEVVDGHYEVVVNHWRKISTEKFTEIILRDYGKELIEKFGKIEFNKDIQETEEHKKYVREIIVKGIFSFFIDRLKVQLKDSGIRHDVIAAVFATGEDDLVRLVARAKALQDFLNTDDGANLLTAYKRAANILAIEEKKDKSAYPAAALQFTSLKEMEEKELATLLQEQSTHIDNLRAKEQFVEAMKLLAGLRSTVDRFFDKIMVNCDDKELRANRLRLLALIRDSMDGVARFSAVEG